MEVKLTTFIWCKFTCICIVTLIVERHVNAYNNKPKKSIHFDSTFLYSCSGKLWLCNYRILYMSIINDSIDIYYINIFKRERNTQYRYCTHIALNIYCLFPQIQVKEQTELPIHRSSLWSTVGSLIDWRCSFSILYMKLPFILVLHIEIDIKHFKNENYP